MYSAQEIAEILYSLMADSDKDESTKAQQIYDLKNALYNIQEIMENPHNNDCWETLYECLESITSVYEEV